MRRGKAVWQVGAIIIVLGILAASWFLLISPKLDEMHANEAAQVSTASSNAALERDIANLEQIDCRALIAELVEFADGVPQQPQFLDYLRSVKDVAADYGTVLTAMSFSEPSPFVAAGLGFDAAEPAEGQVVVPLPIAQADLDAAAEAGLLISTFSVTLSGPQWNLVAATEAIQAEAPRTALISTVSISGTGSTDYSAALNGTIWILPVAPAEGEVSECSLPTPGEGGELIVPTPVPTPTPTPTPSATPSPTPTPETQPAPASEAVQPTTPAPEPTPTPTPAPTEPEPTPSPSGTE